MSAATEHHSQAGPRTDVLLIRVWLEPESTTPLRARLLTTASETAELAPLGVAAGADDICAMVRGWLDDVESGPTGQQ